MSKNVSLFLMIVIGMAGFWWLGQRTQSDILPLSSLDTSEIESASDTKIVELEDGDTFDMEVSYVQKVINGKEHMMLSYNGSIPGPVIKVKQNSTITLNLKNNTEGPTLLHSHGLRLASKFDGTHLNQENIEPGEKFSYTLTFPDAGVYWYHPHLRSDKGQALGLAGTFVVVPENSNYWSEVNREIPIMLSDILLDEDGKIVPFEKEVNHTLMGRYGNALLVNGKTDFEINASQGEVVRLYITNASNARPYKFSIPGVPLKLVGSDSGAYEKEEKIDNITIAPSERYIVEAYFEKSGQFTILHDGPDEKRTLGTVQVSSDKVDTSFAEQFNELRENDIVIAEMSSYRDLMDEPVNKKLILDVEMHGEVHAQNGEACHEMPDGTMMGNCNDPQPMEWEDSMPSLNEESTKDKVKWKFIDEDTGKVNSEIDWQFKVGDKVKMSISNKRDSSHPMHHPIHFHGQRFVILKNNGKPNDNLVWKDTVLVPAGETVEIVLDVTNPGKWMAHCHTAEHLETGMMFTFNVE